ncbi:MAG: hypothetical protein PHI19_04845 [Clostridia bacterium]|nr:hypothetical protein [Clostridia bacterium]
MKKKTILSILVIVVLFLSASALLGCNANSANFQLIVPDQWEMEVGDSRSVDYAFQEAVTDRMLTWSVFPKKKASVDVWGRVTAQKTGLAWVKAENALGQKQSVLLRIVKESKTKGPEERVVDYGGTAITLNSTFQKLVSYHPADSENIPGYVSGIQDYSAYQSAVTEDGAVWTIQEYGVLRVDDNAVNSRDREQRFMGDRYLYSKDGDVLAIVADEANGIWTIMEEGVTHIQMVQLSGEEKAALMSGNTDAYVKRRGMVAQARYIDGEWIPDETDNDGLWTSMYAAGELMRYSVLKNSPDATAEQIAAARQSAMISTEAVLLLSNICMRTGTVEAYIRYQPNKFFDPANGRYYSEVALEEGGDYSLNIPACSPADAFTYAYEQFAKDGTRTYFLDEDYLFPIVPEDWSDPRAGEGEYAKRTRNLEGYVSRTYSFKDESKSLDGYMYWSFNDDGTATGVSTKSETSLGYYLNGENMRGTKVDASGEIPQRLWNDLIGEGYSVEDIIYKGDTSSDEIIGHLFLYKLAFDILGAEDAELKQIIANTMDRLAQHIVDNGYMMVDGTGQPGTWSKFNREFFYNSSQLGGAPLTASVILSLFKLAHYVTGYQKWDNEYRMAALHPSYEYAELMAQYSKQCHMLMLIMLDEYGFKDLMDPETIAYGSSTSEMLTRLFLNYSDEEMAMLAFYLLFQMEDDEELLTYYRSAIDQWWISIKYSENPLWYYIYQLAYPDQVVTDAYGNNIVETAAWSLSRHPIDTRRLSASNEARDDYAEFSLGIEGGSSLSYDCSERVYDFSGGLGVLNALAIGPQLNWGVAAPDERSLHKYNGSTYRLHGDYNPNFMEGATTYTLPFWMGRYHGMLLDY